MSHSFTTYDSYLEITYFVNHGGKNFKVNINFANEFQKAYEREIFG